VAGGRPQNATFLMFFRGFGRKFRCEWIIEFLRRLKEGHKRFLKFKNLKLLKKRLRARKQLKFTWDNSMRAIF